MKDALEEMYNPQLVRNRTGKHLISAICNRNLTIARWVWADFVYISICTGSSES
jgi:Ser-tRNA(Ala) deacylase AlaX